MVIVYVGPEATKTKYVLPKQLLCHQSAYSNAAFKGKFKEGQEQVVHLDADIPRAFELVIQWLYTDGVILPTGVYAEDSDGFDEAISRYLEFAILCDKLLLHPRCDEMIVEKVAEALYNIPEGQTWPEPSHIRAAVTLRKKHPLRAYFASCAAQEYVEHITKGKTFSLKQEVEELEEFAADLLVACNEIWKCCTSERKISSFNPITSMMFTIKNGTGTSEI
jgi:hypothetical protein